MNPHAVRPPVAIVTLAFAIMAGGCGGGQAPVPEPDPRPRYQQLPRDLCDRIRVEEVARRFDLSMAPWYEPSRNYWAEPTHWRVSCLFPVQAETGPYAAEPDEYRSGVSLAVEVYREPAAAEDAYERRSWGEFEYRADHEPGATATEVTGWWDAGISLEWTRRPARADALGVDPEIRLITAAQLVRHENLVVIGGMHAAPRTEHAEVLALQRDLTRALIDETVEHLTITTE